MVGSEAKAQKVNLRTEPGGRFTRGMADYGQFCPVSRGAEIFAERWTPLIVRELLNGSQHFSELQIGLPRISRNLLAQRLLSLAAAGVIERRPIPAGRGYTYHLTAAGEELRPAVEALGAWGYRWAGQELPRARLDPVLLMWFIRRRVRLNALPAGQTVVQFDFTAPRRSFWLRLEPPDVDLCFSDEGFDIDLMVEADVATLTAAWLGRVPLADLVREGRVVLEGSSAAKRAFTEWFGLSPFANGGAERILARRTPG
jgi:DNA-binding HxlR family transcriptional regulator